MCLSARGGGDGGVAKRESERQIKQDSAVGRINSLFGVDDGNNTSEAEANKLKLEELYSGVGNDVSTYLSKDLNDQYDIAKRNNRFSIAQRGMRGSSSEIDIQDRAQKNYDRSILDINNKASNASARMSSADSGVRLDMIQRILSGMSGDTAFTSAQKSMSDNADNLRRQALTQSLDNVFGDTADLNDKKLERRGAQRADDYYGTYFPSSSNKNYSGSVNS